MYETSDIRKNLKIEIDGQPYLVVDFQFVKPGKGNAFTRTRLKNMITGAVLERTYKTGEKLAPALLEEHDTQFLYSDADGYHFMNKETYEQVALTRDHLGDAANWLLENMDVKILYFNREPIGVTPPTFVEMQIIESDPGVKGDTATGATKPAKFVTGATVMVPLFVNEGDWVQIDTRTGEYLRRVSK
jgi:elongation factor P